MAKSKVHDWLTEEGLIKVEGWARDGLTDEQIAHNIGCSVSTYYKWKSERQEFSEAIKKGKEVIDRQVENALLKKALGYEVIEETLEPVNMDIEEYDLMVSIEVEKYKKENPKASQDEIDLFIMQLPRTKMVVSEQKKKQVQGDTVAQIFWLKNRKPQEWRDKRDVEHSGEITNNINEMSKLSAEELRKLAAMGS